MLNVLNDNLEYYIPWKKKKGKKSDWSKKEDITKKRYEGSLKEEERELVHGDGGGDGRTEGTTRMKDI